MKRRPRAKSLPVETVEIIDRIARRPQMDEPGDGLDDDGAIEVIGHVGSDRESLHGGSRTYARDIAAFDERAPGYERGVLGNLHREIAERTANLVLSSGPPPQRVLDVGCGTGYLLRILAAQCPSATELAGVDPAAAMIETAQSSLTDDRIWLGAGIGAENLPFADAAFDVVVTTTSFDHWANQRAGLLECARVLAPDGRFVLVDQFSVLLAATLVVGRRGKARTKHKAAKLLRGTGFRSIDWQPLYRPLISAAIARR